jgi:hypothetical protein
LFLELSYFWDFAFIWEAKECNLVLFFFISSFMVDLPGLDWVSPGYLAGSLKTLPGHLGLAW